MLLLLSCIQTLTGTPGSAVTTTPDTTTPDTTTPDTSSRDTAEEEDHDGDTSAPADTGSEDTGKLGESRYSGRDTGLSSGGDSG